MRGHCERREMTDIAVGLNLNQGNNMSEEKMQLVKMFIEFLDSDKCGKKFKMHKLGRGHHGKFGRFGHHGHGGHCKGDGPHGRHGHHDDHRHHHHGPHHHGKRGKHHGKHGHHHRRHGLHGDNGKFKAQWVIDLTDSENDALCRFDNECNTLRADQDNATTPNEKEQAAVMNGPNCRCFKRRHCRRMICMPRPINNDIGNNGTNENACQTEAPMEEGNNEETQENLTTMVENINIENSH